LPSATNGPRTGPFWDAAEGRVPLPPAAATLGFELVGADPEQGTLEVAFTAGHAFTTPLGHVLGGFLAAMLYDTVGPTVLAGLEPGRFISTLHLTTTFVRETGPGRLVGRGRIVRRVGDTNVVEATLTAADGGVVATATSVVQVVDL
jgi:acyl-coenzyme A thioesterase PaaI-like protein